MNTESKNEFDLCNQRTAMAALEEERRQKQMHLVDMEATSGVSVNTFYAWKGCTREPTLGNLVALAQTLGFDVILRRRQ